MAKLQLYITRSTRTYNSQLNLNPNEDVRLYVKDVRQVLSIVDYDANEKNIFYLLTSTPTGIFVTILRTIPHNPGDHLAAWVYVPADIDIETDDLVSVIKQTTRTISSVKVSGDDVTALRATFAKDYAVRRDAPRCVAMDPSGEWAWRLYGGDSYPDFETFLGDGLWQQSYLPYRGILLIDADLKLTPVAADLTDEPIGIPAVILPPEKSEDGFEPWVYGSRLDRPVRATMGETVTVTWRRQGFDDVPEAMAIDAAEVTPRKISTDDSRKIITPASFRVTSQATHDVIRDCDIRVNGRQITEKGEAFTRGELSHASVSVSAEGYFTYTGKLDLATLTQPLIQLSERRKVYRFEVPVKSSDLGAPIKFEILSQKPLADSPLEGYELTADVQEGASRTNHLRYTGAGVWQHRHAISFGAGLLLGIILMLLFGTCSGNKGKETLAPAANPDDTTAKVEAVAAPAPAAPTVITEDKTQEAVVQEAPAPTPDAQKAEAADADKPATQQQISAACKYLDDSKVWTRTDMEKQPALRGLYDDMNNFRYERLIEYWGLRLGASKQFAEIAKHADMGKHKKERVLKKGSTYNTGDDERINRTAYLNRIDP